MTTLRIADVARRSGVPATALRYYEQVGLLTARRTDNGYRAYDEHDLERLRFITRARRLDISLDQLRELVEVWDTADCAQVQHRMAEAVAARHAETQASIVELMQLAAQLQAAGQRLAGTPAAGRCGPNCPCASEPPDNDAPTAVAVSDEAGDPAALACTLPRGDMPHRLADWRHALGRATAQTPIEGGVALRFPHDAALAAELARLAAVEQACCNFFAFTLRIDADGIGFEVRAPEQASDIVGALFGTPGPSARPAQ